MLHNMKHNKQFLHKWESLRSVFHLSSQGQQKMDCGKQSSKKKNYTLLSFHYIKNCLYIVNVNSSENHWLVNEYVRYMWKFSKRKKLLPVYVFMFKTSCYKTCSISNWQSGDIATQYFQTLKISIFL